jgi:hypothetical protein
MKMFHCAVVVAPMGNHSAMEHTLRLDLEIRSNCNG